ncbi:MAG: CoA transferase [Dehalococcoidia bacterium]|nr:CoA transferase [Dehalococcoidia bacterium]
MDVSSLPGPYSGLRVIEIGRFIAVPFCAQLIADGGADVVKVEAIEGDQPRMNGPIIPTEGRQFLNKNRGKRSLSVELGDPEVVRALQALTVDADIVLANLRPGLATRLGLDYDSVRARNPRVVYAENTAYGNEGPMAGAPGMDIVLQGYTGVAHLTERGPEQQLNPVIDHTAALLMAWGVATALFHRERTGRGQRLDVSLMQAAMVLENNQLTHVDAIDGWRDGFVEYLKDAFAQGASWEEVLRHRESIQPFRMMRAYYGFFRTSDGTVAVACNAATLRDRMREVMDIDDPWTSSEGWLPDDVVAYEAMLYDQVAARFRERPTGEWIAMFRERGLPIGPVRHWDEVMYDDQAWANDYLVRLDHELLGGITMVAPPVKFSDSPLVAKPSPPLGKHSRDVLREAGLDDDAIDGMVARGVVRDGDLHRAAAE